MIWSNVRKTGIKFCLLTQHLELKYEKKKKKKNESEEIMIKMNNKHLIYKFISSQIKTNIVQ